MTLLQIEGSTPSPPEARWPLWRLGFRPFYLLAALCALLSVPWWLWQRAGGVPSGHGLNGLAWHVHEMLYGYVIAVLAGFLLTAVRNWTGRPTPTGWPLAGLALLWLAPRLLLPWLPALPGAVLDLLFLPLLGFCLWRLLRPAQHARNHFVPRLLWALAGLNLGFHLAQNGVLPLDPLLPLRAALMLLVTLSVIMAGRLHPLFTRNRVTVRQVRHERLERVIAPLTLLVLLADLVPLPAALLVPANLLLAALHFWRGWGWGPWATWRHPLLWILHLSYLCLPLALLLALPAALGYWPWLLMEHVLGIGVLGGLTLGMMIRSALGHSGRALLTGWGESGAMAALLLAVPPRLAAWFWPQSPLHPTWLELSAGLWCLAFALFLLCFTTRLNQARRDGKPG